MRLITCFYLWNLERVFGLFKLLFRYLNQIECLNLSDKSRLYKLYVFNNKVILSLLGLCLSLCYDVGVNKILYRQPMDL